MFFCLFSDRSKELGKNLGLLYLGAEVFRGPENSNYRCKSPVVNEKPACYPVITLVIIDFFHVYCR